MKTRANKILSILICITMLIGFLPIRANSTGAAVKEAEEVDFSADTTITNPEQEMNVIIELEGEPLLLSKQAQEQGADSYLQTDEAAAAREKLIKAQDSTQKEILEKINPNAEFRIHFTNTANAFSAVVRRGDVDKIKKLSSVSNVFADEVYNAPEVEITPKLISSTRTIDVYRRSNVSECKGEGTVVAVIDTGVDTTHESMVLSDSTNEKFKKDDIVELLTVNELNAEKMCDGLTANNVYKNRKFPFCFDYVDGDSDAFPSGDDHGVNVAGVIAANCPVAKLTNTNLHTVLDVEGVAPEAQIIGMKVYSEEKKTTVSTIIAAVEDAVKLGVDVINVSLGSSAGFTFLEDVELAEYEPEFVFSVARRAGILVSVAAGNEGRIDTGGTSGGYNINGTYTSNTDNGTINSPASKYHATAVASVTNTNEIVPYIVSPNHKLLPFNEDKGCSDFIAAFDKKTLEYVVIPGFGSQEDYNGLDVNGKLALVLRGDLTFAKKVDNAVSAGAVGVIVYNDSNNKNVVGSPVVGRSTPLILIGEDSGDELKNAVDKRITVDAVHAEGSFPNSNADLMTDSSAWGPTPDLKLKPEIAAPGECIYTTGSNNTYITGNGTSLAAAHFAGAAALMKQYVMKTSKFDEFTQEEKASIIESLLMSTANEMTDERGLLYSPRKQGAGQLDVGKAMGSDVFIQNPSTGKAKVELGDQIGRSFSFNFTLSNLGETEYKYQVEGSLFSEDFRTFSEIRGDFIYPSSYGLNSELLCEGHTINPSEIQVPSGATDAAIVTVPAHGKCTVTINVTLDGETIQLLLEKYKNGFFVEGFVSLKKTVEGQMDLSIPYMGYYGDWTKAPILDGSKGFDELVSPDGSFNYYYGDSYAYSTGYDKDGNVNGFVDNGVDWDGKFDYENIVFSPNGDKYLDDVGYTVCLLRNAKSLRTYITDSSGNIVKNVDNEMYVPKTKYIDDEITNIQLPAWDGTDANGDVVKEGTYNYVISALLDYPGATDQTKSIPIKVDLTPPTVNGFKNNESFETGKTFCGPVRFFVSDKTKCDIFIDEESVTVTDGSFTVYPKAEKQEVVVTDLAWNKTTALITVNSGHTFNAEVAEDKYLKSAADCEHAAHYYKSCSICGESSQGTSGEAFFISGEPIPTNTPKPTATPTPKPTAIPTPKPTATPTPKPTATPTPKPTDTPKPTATPTSTATPTPKPTATPTPTPASVIILGDVTGDKKVQIEDAQVVLKTALDIIELEADKAEAADVNFDNKISLLDANMVLKASLGIIELKPKQEVEEVIVFAFYPKLFLEEKMKY